MYLEIITPDKRIFEGEVNLVQVPGSKGAFTILKNHAPIISTLEAGKITVKEKSGKLLQFDVSGGVVENLKNKIIILVESV
jgi:F-type H+-transporting ATPase subunit epsilon